MNPGIQLICKVLGDNGCYFLSMCYIAERLTGIRADVIDDFTAAQARGLIGEDAFVLDAGKLFSMMAHATYTCLKAGPGHELPGDYHMDPDENEILRYEYTDAAGKVHAHFVVGDGQGSCWYDPMGKSESVRQGKVVSRRILRRA